MHPRSTVPLVASLLSWTAAVQGSQGSIPVGSTPRPVSDIAPVEVVEPSFEAIPGRFTWGLGIHYGYFQPTIRDGAERGFNDDGGFGPGVRVFAGARATSAISVYATVEAQPGLSFDLLGPSFGFATLIGVGATAQLPGSGGRWTLSVGAGHASLRLNDEERESGPCVPFCAGPERGGTSTGTGYRIGIGYRKKQTSTTRFEASWIRTETEADYLDGRSIDNGLIQLGVVREYR